MKIKYCSCKQPTDWHIKNPDFFYSVIGIEICDNCGGIVNLKEYNKAIVSLRKKKYCIAMQMKCPSKNFNKPTFTCSQIRLYCPYFKKEK